MVSVFVIKFKYTDFYTLSERFDKLESEGVSSGGCGRSSCLKRRHSRNPERNQVFTCFFPAV